MSKGDESKNPASELSFATTLLVRDTCMCLHLQRAARAVARRFDERLRPFDLTNGQFSLLMSLNRPAPPLMRDVAALLAMDRTTLTAMLKPLQRRNLVLVTPDEKDRRGRRLTLLPEGRDVLARALPVWKTTEAEVESALSRPDPDAMREALRALS